MSLSTWLLERKVWNLYGESRQRADAIGSVLGRDQLLLCVHGECSDPVLVTLYRPFVAATEELEKLEGDPDRVILRYETRKVGMDPKNYGI